jgi:hypothetical protein
MSTKEQITTAARGRFLTQEVFLDDAKSVSVTVRELSRPERDALNARLFVTDDSGKPITFNAEGQPDPNGDEWKFREGVVLVDEWLAAAMTPQFTVEELHGLDWPDSLKRMIYQEAMKVNGVTVKEAVGN